MLVFSSKTCAKLERLIKGQLRLACTVAKQRGGEIDALDRHKVTKAAALQAVGLGFLALLFVFLPPVGLLLTVV